jgi:hypothetical protein
MPVKIWANFVDYDIFKTKADFRTQRTQKLRKRRKRRQKKFKIQFQKI